MGIKLFGVDIAKEVANAIPSSAMPVAVLRKIAQGALTAGQLTRGGTQTPTTYSTRGICVDFSKRKHPSASNVQVGDKEVLLLAEPLNGVEPAKDDQVDVIEVLNGTSTTRSMTIVQVLIRDPAAATWILQCRG